MSRNSTFKQANATTIFPEITAFVFKGLYRILANIYNISVLSTFSLFRCFCRKISYTYSYNFRLIPVFLRQKSSNSLFLQFFTYISPHRFPLIKKLNYTVVRLLFMFYRLKIIMHQN